MSIDTEFSRYETSTGSHTHLRLGAGAAAEVKQGAASRMVARTTGRAASSTISSTTISMPDDRRSATPLGSQATLESARHEPIHRVTAADDLGRVQDRRAEPELLHCCQHLLWDGRT